MSISPAVRPVEAMLYGMMQLQRKVKLQKFFGDVNRQIDKKEYENDSARTSQQSVPN